MSLIAYVITSTVFLFFMTVFTAVFYGVTRFYLIRKQCWEGGAYSILLCSRLGKTCGQNAQLDRYNDFFLTRYTYSNNQIACNTAIRSYAQVTPVIVCGQSGFT